MIRPPYFTAGIGALLFFSYIDSVLSLLSSRAWSNDVQVHAMERPTDKQLEAVLPGVLQHFQEQAEAMRSVKRSVGLLAHEMHERFNHMDRIVVQQSQTNMQRTAAAFQSAANTLSPSEESSPNESDSAQQDASHTVTHSTRVGTSSDHTGYKYQPNWTDLLGSARNCYNQWYGLGNYVSIPVEGGIGAMEDKHKANWRLWTQEKQGGRQKKFSRLKKIINEVERLTGPHHCRCSRDSQGRGRHHHENGGTGRHRHQQGQKKPPLNCFAGLPSPIVVVK